MEISDSGTGSVRRQKPSAGLHRFWAPGLPAVPAVTTVANIYPAPTFCAFGPRPLQVPLGLFSLPACPDLPSTFVFNSMSASRNWHVRFLLLL